MPITIKEEWVAMGANFTYQSRTYNTRYVIEGLANSDCRPQIEANFPVPGSFPVAMPDGRPLIDEPMRVTNVTLVKSWCGGAIVDVGMEARIGTFDVSGTLLLNMRLSAAVQYVPSNFSIGTDGLRDAFAKVRYIASVPVTPATDPPTFTKKLPPYERIGQLSVPQNRRSVTIVQAEPNASGLAPLNSHFNKMQFCSFTNSTTFWGGAARTWLCTALSSDWTGFPDYPWRTTYQFVYNPNQWTGVAYFEDQSLKVPMKDILPPANFDPGTESASPYGCKVFRISGEADFNTLNLPNVTAAG